MFDAGSDIFALYAVDERTCDLGCQTGILGIILKIPSAQRRTLDIDCWSKDDAHALCLTLVSEGFSHLLQQFTVKGCRRSASGRETYRFDAFVYSQMIRLIVLLSQTVRSIGHHARRDAQTLHSFCVPKVRAGAHRRFLLQCHF